MVLRYSFIPVIVASPCVWRQIPVLSFLLAEEFVEVCDEMLLTLNSLNQCAHAAAVAVP